MIRNFRSVLFMIIGLGSSAGYLMAQSQADDGSTDDLSFLIGDWSVVRTYSPNSDNKRILEGTLTCKESLDGQFINCRYEIERPGKIRGVDEVFFNYNSIYKMFESIWLSSTWPIKVLMQGTFTQRANDLVLNTKAQFRIQGEVTEFVKDELTIGKEETDQTAFTRQTFIRTSEDKEGDWHHHMTEVAEKVH